jgi:hypothetical protein
VLLKSSINNIFNISVQQHYNKDKTIFLILDKTHFLLYKIRPYFQSDSKVQSRVRPWLYLKTTGVKKNYISNLTSLSQDVPRSSATATATEAATATVSCPTATTS